MLEAEGPTCGTGRRDGRAGTGQTRRTTDFPPACLLSYRRGQPSVTTAVLVYTALHRPGEGTASQPRSPINNAGVSLIRFHTILLLNMGQTDLTRLFPRLQICWLLEPNITGNIEKSSIIQLIPAHEKVLVLSTI